MASDIRKQISAAAENSRNGQVFVDHAGKRHWNTTGRVLMEKILYDLMDWAGIEELVYSEASDPGRLLGERNKGRTSDPGVPSECGESLRKDRGRKLSDGDGG